MKGIDTLPWEDVELDYELKKCLDENEPDLGDEKKRKIRRALQKITYAVKNTLDVKTVTLGYQLSGQQPPNFKLAMRETMRRRTISDTVFKKMEDAVPKLAELYLDKGFVTEEDMDNLEIPNFNDECYSSVPKDQRALHQQRAVVMNAEGLMGHILALKNKKIEAEEQKKQQAQLQAARRTAAAREKQDYDNWFKNLTPNEQAQERRRIREANRTIRLAPFHVNATQQTT